MRKYFLSYFFKTFIGDFGILSCEIDIDSTAKKSEIINSVQDKMRLRLAEKYNAEIAEKAEINIIAISEL